MRWRLILEEFGPDIKHIKGEDNVVADAISRLPMSEMTMIKEHFALEEDEAEFPLDLHLTCQRTNKELNEANSKLKQLIDNKESGYNISVLDDVKIVTFENKIYVPKALRRRALEWYHHFLNHPGGDRLYHTLQTVCYWKGMANQATALCKRCDECQRHKPRKRKYGKLPARSVGELVPWHTVHTDLIGPYSITAKQFHTDGSIVERELSLTCMTMIDPVTGWFEIVEVPSYIVDDVNKKLTKEQIDKSSACISRLFDQAWLSRYPRPNKVVFDNGSEFKKDFVPLLQDWSVKPVCTTIKNPQANSPVCWK